MTASEIRKVQRDFLMKGELPGTLPLKNCDANDALSFFAAEIAAQLAELRELIESVNPAPPDRS